MTSEYWLSFTNTVSESNNQRIPLILRRGALPSPIWMTANSCECGIVARFKLSADLECLEKQLFEIDMSRKSGWRENRDYPTTAQHNLNTRSLAHKKGWSKKPNFERNESTSCGKNRSQGGHK